MHFRMTAAAAAAVMGMMVVLHSTAALAKDDLLETLAQKGVLNADEYAKLKAQRKADATFSTDNGFKITAGDGSASIQFGTLQQLDFAAADSKRVDLADGTQLRRSRLSIAGVVLKDWQYRVEYEFASLPNAATTTGVTDAYVAYTGYQPLTVTIGNFKPPVSMEAIASDKNLTFMERGLPFAFINVGSTRSPGVMVGHAGANWTANLGVFGEPLNTAQTAAGDEGYGVVGRFTYAPIVDGQHLLHLGLSSSYRATTQNTGTGGVGRSVSFSSKPEANQINQSFVSTGLIAGNVQHFSVEDFELAAQSGAASLQAEYLLTQVSRDVGGDLGFSGWYAQAAYTLTGEARPYKADKGVFDSIRPARNFGADGWGAFEVAARMSAIDLNDKTVTGGKQRNAALALNWYPNPLLRASANVVKVMKIEGGSFKNNEPTIFEMRLQLAF